MQAIDTATRSPINECSLETISTLRGVLRIAAFLGLIITLALVLDGFIGMSLRRVTNGDFGEWNRIVSGKVNADIVITGSSRALTHYDPRILEGATGYSAYNIGLNGSQTDMQLARFKTYLRHNRKPQILIHHLDAFSFQLTHGEVYDPGQYVPDLHESDLYEALTHINAHTRKARYLRLYGYAAQDLRFSWVQGMGGWGFGSQAATHLKGFLPRHRAWTGEFENFPHANVTLRIEPDGVRAVEELVQLCAAQGIKLVLVYSPEYRQAQSMTRNRAEIFARFADISRRHGAALIDFSESAISRDQRLFYNSQHLNAAGAEAFTADLAARLASMMPPSGRAAVDR